MDSNSLDKKITARSREFFASISGEAPSIFNKGWWTGKVMDWSMKNENFKVQLFRFVDVLPYLTTSESLARHIREYFAGDDQDVPAVMKWGAIGTGFGGKLTGVLVNRTIRTNLEAMAKQFIIGENVKDRVEETSRRSARTASPSPSISWAKRPSARRRPSPSWRCTSNCWTALEKSYRDWVPIGGDTLDWGYAPRINISVKPSALFSLTDPMDFEGSVTGICNRLVPILRKVRELGGFMRIDMEHHPLQGHHPRGLPPPAGQSGVPRLSPPRHRPPILPEGDRCGSEGPARLGPEREAADFGASRQGRLLGL